MFSKYSDAAAPFRRLARYALVGGGATLIHLVVVICFVDIVGVQAPLANAVAFLVAATFSFLANAMWSFSVAWNGRTLIRYIAVALGGCLLSAAVARFGEALGLDYRLAVLLVVLLVTPVTFIAHNYWTFMERCR